MATTHVLACKVMDYLFSYPDVNQLTAVMSIWQSFCLNFLYAGSITLRVCFVHSSDIPSSKIPTRESKIFQYQFCLIFNNIISKSQFEERRVPVLIGKKSQQKRVFQESKMPIPFLELDPNDPLTERIHGVEYETDLSVSKGKVLSVNKPFLKFFS